MVTDDPGIRVQTAAAAALGEYGDNKAVPVLAKALGLPDTGYEVSGHRDGTMRRTAVRSLSKIGTAEAMTALYEGAREGPAKLHCQEFWFGSKDPKHLPVFLKMFDDKPLDANLGAAIIQSLLRSEKRKELTPEEKTRAEADFLKSVDDPKRFGPTADLTEKGKYSVHIQYTFHNREFATISIGIRPAAPRSLGGGTMYFYRKIGEKWKLLGTTGGWNE
jgi:hypothetical protein